MPKPKADLESEVQQQLMIAAVPMGAHLQRNNNGALRNEHGGYIRFGLGNVSEEHSKLFTSSDLIGIYRRLITIQDVGKFIGQFAAIEVKRPGWTGPSDAREVAQANYIEWVRLRFGVAGFATCEEDLKQILK